MGGPHGVAEAGEHTGQASQGQEHMDDDPGVESSIARPGGVSYLALPATDVGRSAAFYQAVFGWELRGDPDQPSFSDGTGHVIGHWRTDLAPAGEAGVRHATPCWSTASCAASSHASSRTALPRTSWPHCSP